MQEFLRKCRYYFLYGAFFSLFVNILALTFPVYMLQIYDKVISSHSYSTLVVITIAALFALFLSGLLTWIRSRLMVSAGIELDHQLGRNVLYNNIKTSGGPLGTMQSEATLADVSTLRNLLGGSAIFSLFDTPFMPVFFIVLFMLHPAYGWIGVFGGILTLIFGLLTERMTKKRLNEANAVNGQASTLAAASVRNSDIVRTMGMMGALSDRWERLNHRVMNLQTQASAKAGGIGAISGSCRMSLQILVYCTGAWLTLSGDATPGGMIAASIIMGRALAPVTTGISSYKSYLNGYASYKRLKALEDKPQTVHMELPPPTGEISVEGVFFGIHERQIIKGVSFMLPAGQSLAIIGASAAGKSTLCKLLLNLWQPLAGKIRFDKATVDSWDPEKLGPYLGYLPQDVEMFDGTIAENIARMQALDSDKILYAAKMAGIHEMILQLPRGYDTPVGKNGGGLSGGQRQRIGLARALYGQPHIVVLDEPNSNLDEEGDFRLIQALAYLHQQKTTVIIVTHKMQILNIVDNIMLMQDGRIALYGPRQQVMAKFAEMQNRRNEEAAKARQAQTAQEELQKGAKPGGNATGKENA